MDRSKWEYKKLGDCCKVINGLWTGKKPPFINVGVIRNANFTKSCELDNSNIAYIDVELKAFEKRKLIKGDIIIEKSGGSDKQPVGRPILFNMDGDFSFSNFTSTLRIEDRKHLDSNYLHKVLKYNYLMGHTKAMQSNTTGLHNLDFSKYKAQIIPIPSIVDQQRIVAELDCLNEMIALKQEQLKEFDKLAQSIFYDIFWGDAYSKQELSSLYEFIDYRGKTPNKISAGIPLITARNIRFGYLDYSVQEYISEDEFETRKSRGIAKKGDLLFTTEAPMGFAAIADLDVFSTGQRVITFQLKNGVQINNLYMLYYLMSEEFQQILLNNATGVTVKGIKAAKLKRIKVSIPPLALQQQFAEKIQAIEAQKELVKKSIAETQQLLDSRMDFYFD